MNLSSSVSGMDLDAHHAQKKNEMMKLEKIQLLREQSPKLTESQKEELKIFIGREWIEAQAQITKATEKLSALKKMKEMAEEL
ncbi:MAG: hypothetical protein Solivirus2_56 [Solivirus sp.]|uniref:Uncharacterized protein n=1 Tax=Solivirus sp. TaxID=2487772 RepID=A0A3G5AFI8_9VIRU|nr:MAG: hypothetical protein Solivirus2_56 [Solivirus sp.]